MAAALVDAGVDTLFGLIGDSNLFLVNAFVEQHRGRYLSAVHEAGAVMMAAGYAARSGKLGVATVTQGPGLTNATTALVEAVRADAPLLLLVGDTVPGNPANIQSLDQGPLVRAVGAEYVQVDKPADAAEAVLDRALVALAESRPIVVNCPTAFQWDEVGDDRELPRHPAAPAVLPLDEEQLDRAVGLMTNARRPIVLAGRGALGDRSRDAVLRLARRLGAPLMTTLRARSLYDASDGSLGVFGTLSTAAGVQAVADADCVVAMGASLNTWTTDRNELLQGKTVVQVDRDPGRIGRTAPVDAGVVGDVADAADTIVEWLDLADLPPSSFRDRLTDDLCSADLRWSGRLRGSLDLAGVLAALNRALPAERTIVYDGGRFLGEAFKYLDVVDPRHQVLSTAFGAVGMGMGAAVGAAAAAPGTPTVLVTGDGGFMMSGVAELHSAVRAGLPLTVVVCNDGSYGAEYDQYVARGVDPALSMFSWPSFADIARTYGVQGFRIETPGQLVPALEAVRAGGRTIVIDVVLGVADVPEVPH